MEALRALLDALGVRGRLGADQDGYPWVFGYRGPSLGELTGAVRRAPIAALVEDQMAIKSDAEIALLRESCEVGEPRAHAAAAVHAARRHRDGGRDPRVEPEATSAMLDAIGPIYRAQSLWFDGASAGYRGQIGRNAAIPHALAEQHRLRRPATSSSPARPRPSGATTPSSSGRW